MLSAMSTRSESTKKKLSVIGRLYGGPREYTNASMTYWYVDMRNTAVFSMVLVFALKSSTSGWLGTNLKFRINH